MDEILATSSGIAAAIVGDVGDNSGPGNSEDRDDWSALHHATIRR
jgi:hypothetical protein